MSHDWQSRVAMSPKFLTVGFTFLALSVGCATSPSVPTDAAALADRQAVEQLQSELDRRQRALEEENARVSSLSKEVEQLRSQGAATSASRSSDITGVQGAELLPPSAKAGECYARAYSPPVYQTSTDQMLKTAAATKIRTIPAKFESADERVMVKEGSSRLEIVPATYETVEERVMSKPASTRLEVVPATFDLQEERILVKPATTMWKRGSGPIQRVDEATGEIMCMVEVPAEYKTVQKRVLKTPASTRTVEIPAQYQVVKRRVQKTPATTRTIEIPAEYKTVKVQRLVQPAREETVEIPAEYQTVSRREQVSAGRMEWRPVLCETNATPAVISQIQRALDASGHNPGPIDGVIGAQTLTAVRAYQQAKRLPTGGLNYATIDSLGVKVGR